MLLVAAGRSGELTQRQIRHVQVPQIDLVGGAEVRPREVFGDAGHGRHGRLDAVDEEVDRYQGVCA